MKINVVSGDITQVNCDAIVTLINPFGAWNGGVDRAIMKTAGRLYHQQVSQYLQDGESVVAKGQMAQHNGKFNNVIFVIDTLESPTSLLVAIALSKAKDLGYKHLAIPVFRTGVMLGEYPNEPDVESTVKEIVRGIRAFAYDGLTISIVVYHDPDLEKLVRRSIGH